jgi:histidyl-tRNA synthetase
MVRGLDYYTGPIYETVVEEPRIGSLTGGGRYDGLVARFSAQGQPATGTTIGIERIIDVMEELKMFPPEGTTVEVLVTVFSSDLLTESLKLLTELRGLGLRCELFYGTDPLGTQIRYALKKGIPLVVILGPEELAADQVAVRDLATRSQTNAARAEVGSRVQELLDRRD